MRQSASVGTLKLSNVKPRPRICRSIEYWRNTAASEFYIPKGCAVDRWVGSIREVVIMVCRLLDDCAEVW